MIKQFLDWFVLLFLKIPISRDCFCSGWFAYVSPQSYVGDRKKATLVSQYLSGKKCISLSYCMNGKSMGTLEFYLQKISGGYAIFPPKKKGHQGKEWHHLEFSLNHASYDQTKYRVSNFVWRLRLAPFPFLFVSSLKEDHIFLDYEFEKDWRNLLWFSA